MVMALKHVLLLAAALLCFDPVNGFTTHPFNVHGGGRKVGIGIRSTSFQTIARPTQRFEPRRRNLKTTNGSLQQADGNQTRRRRWNSSAFLPRKFNFLTLWLSSLRKSTVCKLVLRALLTVVLSISLFANSAFAVTGGRMGGSFGPSGSSSSSSRGSPSPPSSSRIRYHQPRMRSYYSAPRIFGHSHTVVYPSRPVYLSRGPQIASPRISPVFAALATGVVVYAIATANTDGSSSSSKPRSALGPGVSVASLTLAMNVPDRDDPDSILMKLKRFSDMAQTDTRRGVQDLITNVSLELLRQEKSVVSASSTYQHFSTANEAQREFNRLSIQQRSKFDNESVNKYSGKDMGVVDKAPSRDPMGRATAAVVTIALSIEGDETRLPQIRTRKDLAGALSRIASDAPVGECLLSAEVLWAPSSRSETLSKEEIVMDYPNLFPI